MLFNLTLKTIVLKQSCIEINGLAKTELCQKVLLQLSVRELNIHMLEKYATRFSMAYDKK